MKAVQEQTDSYVNRNVTQKTQKIQNPAFSLHLVPFPLYASSVLWKVKPMEVQQVGQGRSATVTESHSKDWV